MTVPACLVALMLGAARKVLTFHTSASDATNATSYTFSAQAIGAVDATRRVIVGVGITGATASDTVGGVTVGGIAATEVVQDDSADDQVCSLWIAHVPTGTTADVVVTIATNALNCAIGVWSATGLTSSTPIDFDSSNADPSDDTLTGVEGGFCVSMAMNGEAGGSSGTMDWTGTTEQFEIVLSDSSDITAGGASTTTSGTTVSPVVTYTGGDSEICVSATW